MPADAYEDYMGTFPFEGGGDRFLGQTLDGLRVFSSARRQLVGILDGHGGAVSAAVFGREGGEVFSSGQDYVVRRWDLAQVRGEPLLTLQHARNATGASGAVWAAFDGARPRIVSADGDGSIRTWDAASAAPLDSIAAHDGRIWSAAGSADGRRLATGGADRAARVWDLASGARIASIELDAPVRHVALSTDGRILATRTEPVTEALTRTWDVERGAALAELAGHAGRLSTTRFAPRGERVLTASYDGTARVWDARSGALLLDLPIGPEGPCGAAWDGAGARIATVGRDGGLRLWDAASGRLLREAAAAPDDAGTNLAFSPDGQRVAAGRLEAALVWDLRTNQVLPLEGRRRGGNVAFSPDGRLVAAASARRNAVSVWSAEDGRQLAGWNTPGMEHFGLAFSADGSRLVTPGFGLNPESQVWDVSLETRSPAAVAAIIECKSSWRVDGDELVPQSPHPDRCAAP